MRSDKIKRDIQSITEVVGQGDFDKVKNLYQELYSTYNGEIQIQRIQLLPLQDLSKRFKNFYSEKNEQIPRVEIPENYIKNLDIIKGMLELLIPDEKVSVSPQGLNVHINNNNQSSASNVITIDINISFDDVRKRIESMEEVIGSDEVEAIKAKVDELQSIIESTGKKTEKWKRIKDIGKWIFDKSIDVGIALLPLILKIN